MPSDRASPLSFRSQNRTAGKLYVPGLAARLGGRSLANLTRPPVRIGLTDGQRDV